MHGISMVAGKRVQVGVGLNVGSMESSHSKDEGERNATQWY